MLGIILGVIYFVVGITGFFLTSAYPFAAASGPRMIDLFQTNPLQNLGHIAVGVAMLIAGLVGPQVSRIINILVGLLFLLLGGVAVLVSAGNNPLNILALNGADAVLYFASAVVLLAVGLGSDRRAPAAGAS
jgi:hypothetical protein